MADTIVLYPSPGRGHLVSMVEFGQLILKHHPASIAIIIPTLPFDSASSSIAEDYIASVSASSSMISFHHLPAVDPLPPTFSFSSSPAEIPALTYELAELNNPNLHKTLMKLSKSSKLKAFVIDFFCNASFKVSSTFHIPTYYYFTSGASGLAAFLYFKTFHENTTKSLKDFDNMLLDFPGIPSIPAKDMPVAMLDRESKVYRCFVDTATQMIKSAGLILNTLELLEERALKAILDGQCTPGESAPPIYCVGPVSGGNEGRGCGEVQHECLSWLDSQPSRSVVFLSFGSMGVFYTKQLTEIANGLESSRVRFLWVVRAPPPDDETRRTITVSDLSIERFLPEGFLDRTKDRGLVVKSWAPQIAVLSHDSVGGFVTHCGWNSVLEGVCAGVPMLAWPLYAEQKMNRAFLVEEMKVALSVVESDNGLVTAAELEKRVTELMDSENGRVIRSRITVLREEAVAATSHGGSSHLALAKLAESFKRN
ncbi:hypothetical protein Ddye_013865 [Dipteronia dyeriana]|uniref:Glycosyltransferase n=1 Tax=Dipteronia dyeriana TaxID=168575 RepID=A0AAE0CK21_9ROSI|nr:hypothetical protein Ddye_013865 [Dipteronia dyeriana]